MQMELGVVEMRLIFCGKHPLLVTRTQVSDPGTMGHLVYLLNCVFLLIDLKLILNPYHVEYLYGKCSKILNPFLFLFSNKMMVIKSGNSSIAFQNRNQERSQKQSDLGLSCLSRPF